MDCQRTRGRHNNRLQLQRRCAKTKRRRAEEAAFRTDGVVCRSREPPLHRCIVLRRTDHSYPAGGCIYQQRPGCSGGLAPEDHQTRRSKQYPVKAAGVGEDPEETLGDLSQDYSARGGGVSATFVTIFNCFITELIIPSLFAYS